ncbi:ATP-binding cassette domain-containing protein [Aestuariibius sp. HNIBRBA575]|uniref:thiamine ABC transporter ATP-binding protein n=1 Tax=Aestuariibius sp. HNIBRBA575 TaxID=3233343 RepID=UPI0034A437DF
MLKLDQVALKQGEFRLEANFALHRGITAIIGPSGGGKSTLLAAIAGFLIPDRGQILWQDRDLAGLAPGARPVAMLFQDNNLFPHLTIGQNVGLGMSAKRLSADQRNRVQDVLKQVGLPDMSDRKPNALSGGQQSRAALARVLVQDQPLVLLDEPFSALGPGLKDEMLDLFVRVLGTEGRQLVMVTHDPADARRVADQVVFVDAGTASAPIATPAFFDSDDTAIHAYLGRAS